MRLTIAAAGVAALFTGACAQELPKTPAEAEKLEAADTLPLTKFYDTPKDLAASKPGDLLRKEAFGGYALPKGATAVRILYHSLDAEGKDVATSGVVLIPAGKAPAGGWPVIAWAHGTSGVARICAPSLAKDVYYGDEGLMPMVAAGYAVVASDYHGLGTEGPHQYVNKTAQGHDVIYGIPAARAAVPSLGARWVADGHSQGGLAVWAVAEQEADLKDPTYLGAVSVAGATSDIRFLDHLAETDGVGFYLSFMAFGVKARYPEFKVSDLLTDAALSHYDAVTTKGCWYYGYASYAAVKSATLMKPDSSKNEWVQKFWTGNAVTEKPVAGPIFIVAGEADQSVPLEGLRNTFKKACHAGMNVSFRSYPGLDHDPVMEKSTPDQLAWIKDRFDGKPTAGDCGKQPG